MFHIKGSKEVISKLKTDESVGLTQAEAAKRQQKYGANLLKEKKKKTLFSKLLDQFKDVMIIILIFAAVISLAISIVEGENSFLEPILIILIVINNAVMGVIQESKAEKALEALKNMSAPHARVIRGGEEMIIDSKNLVVGDIIMLESGDFVPADARLLWSASLKSEESALTGESVPSEKDAEFIGSEKSALGDRHNLVSLFKLQYRYGSGKAVVTAIGMDTEVGKIAGLLDGEENAATPLQRRLAQLGKYLGIIAIGACAVIFVIGLIAGIPLIEIFMISISLAVSAIPEGLPAIVTIVLSIGVTRMVKRNAIIKKLPAVETLGSASVICSDKTGTLTQNRMTLVKFYTDENKQLSDLTYHADENVKKILLYASLCSDGIVAEEDGIVKFIGDPTETSIVFAAMKNGMPKNTINEKYERIAELPFESERKLMSTVNVIDGKKVVIVKGAFDVLVNRCIKGDLTHATEISEKMSADALRVIAVAYKTIDSLPEINSENLESGLTFLGLLGIIDPPRYEAKRAVEVCRQAGIKPVMITGDHITTASAIAKQLGIMIDGDEAILGSELAAMSEKQLADRVDKISVYARVSPEDKIRIVKAWQAQGRVVAMTGDGVNDAPALKAADIGCAMGITGTDVAKGAADMILTDDNFATIVDAVKEGRGIYDNIKKVVGFLLGTNVGEVLVVFIAMLVWQRSPFIAIQLLWINLATDSLPAIALGMEEVERDVMDRKPTPKDENMFAGGFGIRIILQGMMFAALSLFGYLVGLNEYKFFDSETQFKAATTMAFIILAMTQIFHSFNMRSNKSLFTFNPFSNKYLNLAVVVSSLLIVIIVFIPPVSAAFGLIRLPAKMYFIALSFAFSPVIIMEIAKWIKLVK